MDFWIYIYIYIILYYYCFNYLTYIQLILTGKLNSIHLYNFEYLRRRGSKV